MKTRICAGLMGLALCAAAPATANALPPISENDRIMGQLVAGEVGYQIHKHCPTISMRRLRALGRLNRLADYARDLGYTDADFDALSKDPAARALRDGRVDKYLAAQGVTKGDADSYCRLGYEEIEKGSFAGSLLRAR